MDSYGDKERREDFSFFVEHYQELYELYGETFLVIKGKKVIGSYENEVTAIEETTKVLPLGSFIVQKCDGDESAYTNYINTTQFSFRIPSQGHIVLQ